MHQSKETICPEIPNGLQPVGKGAEVQHGSPDGTQQGKTTKFPIGTFQQKTKACPAQKNTVAAVQQRDEPGQPQTKGAQQIVANAHGQPQQDRLQKIQQLLGDLKSHLRQPKRRLNSPGALWG